MSSWSARQSFRFSFPNKRFAWYVLFIVGGAKNYIKKTLLLKKVKKLLNIVMVLSFWRLISLAPFETILQSPQQIFEHK